MIFFPGVDVIFSGALNFTTRGYIIFYLSLVKIYLFKFYSILMYQVKIIERGRSIQPLEALVNAWLSANRVDIVSINYQNDSVLILYRT